MGSGENFRFGRKFWVRVKILGLGDNFELTFCVESIIMWLQELITVSERPYPDF